MCRVLVVSLVDEYAVDEQSTRKKIGLNYTNEKWLQAESESCTSTYNPTSMKEAKMSWKIS